MKYIIYAKLTLEIEADDVGKAQLQAEEKFKELEKNGVKVEDAKVVDKNTGYFLK